MLALKEKADVSRYCSIVDVNLIEQELRHYARPGRVSDLARFFKTEPGEYGEGDQFLGLTVPDTRLVAKKFKEAFQ